MRATIEVDEGLQEVWQRAAAAMAARDQRLTSNRRRVLAVLYGADRPMSVEEILDADPGLPQSSAYRDVRLLRDVGAVRPRYLTDDRVHFELAPAGTDKVAYHFVCIDCRAIVTDVAPESLQRQVASAMKTARGAGFEPSMAQLLGRGRCAACAAENPAKRAR